MKNTIIAIILFAFSACEKQNIQPSGTPHFKHPHHGNFRNNQDSAMAVQTYYQFPPTFNPVTYPTLQYNTGIAVYDSITSSFTITQTGNYSVIASSYRDLQGDSSDLQLGVNGNVVYSTGLLPDYPISFTTNVHLFQGDVIDIRTSTSQGVEPNGIFKILR